MAHVAQERQGQVGALAGDRQAHAAHVGDDGHVDGLTDRVRAIPPAADRRHLQRAAMDPAADRGRVHARDAGELG